MNFTNLTIHIFCKKCGLLNFFFKTFFENFYPFIKENFLKNYDKLIEFAENKNNEFKLSSNEFRTGFYCMKITVDYNKVIENLKQSREMIEIM